MLSIDNDPHRAEPLSQLEVGVLENGARRDGELTLWVLCAALPATLVRQESDPSCRRRSGKRRRLASASQRKTRGSFLHLRTNSRASSSVLGSRTLAMKKSYPIPDWSRTLIDPPKRSYDPCATWPSNTASTSRIPPDCSPWVWTNSADALIGCWNAKYTYSFWRPVTAIRNGEIDGNAATVADPAWTPLANTPLTPNILPAHGCFTGAEGASTVFAAAANKGLKNSRNAWSDSFS